MAEDIIKKSLKKLKKKIIGIDTDAIEHDLIPLKKDDYIQPKVLKKKKEDED